MINRDKLDLETYYQSFGIFGKALEEKVSEGLRLIDEGYPLAYLVKEAYFYDLVFTVDERVLIPRPDTERLCEKAIALLPAGATFIDLGTGSGCIAVTVLHHRPDVRGYALDLSPDALSVAKHNAMRYGVSDRLTLLEGDMKEVFSEGVSFDLIISNPPYIPSGDIPKYPTLVHEPQMALDGGEDGMDFYRFIIKKYRDKLTRDGEFIFEIGYDQGEAIRLLCEQSGLSCEITKDYGGNDRVARIIKL